MAVKGSNIKPDNSCPFLGLFDDPSTAMDYPAERNYCHRCFPSSIPSLSQQREVCLTLQYLNCPIYLQDNRSSMPKEILSEYSKNSGLSIKKLLAIILVILILLITAFLILYRFTWGSMLFSTSNDKAPMIENISITSTLATAMMSATPGSTATATKSIPTLTITPIALHLLETPIGNENKLVVHQVKDGESLIGLADTYNTTVVAIQAINVSSPTFMWVNTLVVIPVGNFDVSNIPKLKAILFEEEGTTLKDVATKYSVDLTMLSKINQLPETYTFHQGECVLIPQGQEVQ